MTPEQVSALSDTQLKIICDMAIELTVIKMRNCEHLSIENFTPELLGKLLASIKYQ